MPFDFSGRTAIVTGAAHGFGRAIAVAFARAGAHVWACDVVADELKQTRELCAAAGTDARCEVRVVDVTDARAVDAFVAEAVAATGRIDVLVNNAGGVLGQIGRPIEEISPADWQAIFDVNVSGAFYFSRAVTPAMKRARFGR